MNNDQQNVKDIDVSKEMRASFLSYAMSVLKSRAIPDVRDGLKPVHRRIIYAMHELGIFHDKPFKKSARIVGEVIGKYHPHGDSAIYETIVRMAQDFSLRYPLISGQGNFGSIDGDSAAAMRYTELKMSKIASELILELNKDTVNFVSNYDDSEREPMILPSFFPNLLVNGTSGIAVSMATNIPSHNLSEVVDALIFVLNNPQITIEQIIAKKIITGPDFPTGASIVGTNGIEKAYLTSKGSIVLRSKIVEETLKNGNKVFVITEIPYQVNKLKLVEKITEVWKQKKVEGIAKVQDESGRKGIRVVIELKKEANEKLILNRLFKLTPMQVTYTINLVALNKNRPLEMNLLQLIKGYLDHQYEILVRKTKFDLKKSQEKAHIALGIIIALKNINEIVNLIKKTKGTQEAVSKLKVEFALTEIQAQAILQMRLQRLTALEQEKIDQELINLKQAIVSFEHILNNVGEQTEIIIKQLLAIKDKYGDERRTSIIAEEIEPEDDLLTIENEKVVILLSENGYIKRLSIEEYRTQKRGGVGINTMNLNETDDISKIIIANTHDDILFFSDLGKVYLLKAHEISSFSRFARGTPIINLININNQEKIKTLIAINNDTKASYLFFVTTKGLIKRTKISEFDSIRKSGKIAIELKENDTLCEVLLTTGDDELVIATGEGKAVRFLEKTVRVLQRTATGIKGISVDCKKSYVIGACSSATGSKILTISENGIGKVTELSHFRLTQRATKGVNALKINSRTGKLQVIKSITGDEEILIISDNGIIIRLELEQMKISQRNSSGVRLIKLKSDQKIKTVAVISSN